MCACARVRGGRSVGEKPEGGKWIEEGREQGQDGRRGGGGCVCAESNLIYTVGMKNGGGGVRGSPADGGRWRGRKKDSGVLVKVSSPRIACCAIPSSDLLCRLTDERGRGGEWGERAVAGEQGATVREVVGCGVRGVEASRNKRLGQINGGS